MRPGPPCPGELGFPTSCYGISCTRVWKASSRPRKKGTPPSGNWPGGLAGWGGGTGSSPSPLSPLPGSRTQGMGPCSSCSPRATPVGQPAPQELPHKAGPWSGSQLEHPMSHSYLAYQPCPQQPMRRAGCTRAMGLCGAQGPGPQRCHSSLDQGSSLQRPPLLPGAGQPRSWVPASPGLLPISLQTSAPTAPSIKSSTK